METKEHKSFKRGQIEFENLKVVLQTTSNAKHVSRELPFNLGLPHLNTSPSCAIRDENNARDSRSYQFVFMFVE